MKKKSKEILYQPGKIKNLVEGVARMVAKNPELADDFDRLHATIATALPGYGDRSSCFNCGHNMEVTEYTAGIVEAILLLKMAVEVRHRMLTMPFTEANVIHVPTLATTDAVRHSITRASYLGLVAQPPKFKGSGHWVITHWGWKMLRGESIPRKTRYWRGKLIDRSEDQTTLAGMFQTHTELIKKALARRKQIDNDYRADIGAYTPSDWISFGGYAEDVVKPAEKETPPTTKPWWVRD